MSYFDKKISNILVNEDLEQFLKSKSQEVIDYGSNKLKTTIDNNSEQIRSTLNEVKQLAIDSGVTDYLKKTLNTIPIFKEKYELIEIVIKKYSKEAELALSDYFSTGNKHAFDGLIKKLERDPDAIDLISDGSFSYKIASGLARVSKFWDEVILANPGKSGLIVLICIIISGFFINKKISRKFLRDKI